ncbi:MAG: hypothetical protein ACE5HT_12900 [Gemmatimonadales bacterium]
MAAELGSSQLSSLLESVPGLANVLRSPVADAIVNLIRAGVGLDNFRIEDASELIQYATRRSLITETEGAQLLDEISAVVGRRPRRKSKKTSKKKATKKARRLTRISHAKTGKKLVKRSKTAKGQAKKKKKATKTSKARKTSKKTAKKSGRKG